MGGRSPSNSRENDSRKSIHVFERDCSVQLRKQKAELVIMVSEWFRSSKLHRHEAVLCTFLEHQRYEP